MTGLQPLTGGERLLRAARRQPTDCTPVWFMRQAGRCLPDYRALRARYSMLDLTRNPELAAAITVMPVDQLGVDGAVLFADIVTPLLAVGIDLTLEPSVGPVLAVPFASQRDIDRIQPSRLDGNLDYLRSTISLTRQHLADNRAAVLGFAGAPFTLACYLIDGKPQKGFPKTRALIASNPQLWHALMTRLTELTSNYLAIQVAAGAAAIQLFDSWVGLLSPAVYAANVAPYTRQIFASLADRNIPRIHFGTDCSHLLAEIATTDCDVISVDWRISLPAAQAIAPNCAIQGNLDPAILLGNEAGVMAAVDAVLQNAVPLSGHIFNLGHGVFPDTDWTMLRRVVERVHTATA